MKHIAIIFVLVSIVNKSNAQITMGLKLGGHLPTSRIALPGFVQIESDGTQKVLLSTLGGGIDFNGLICFDISKNVAFGLDMGYFSGFKIDYYQHVNSSGVGDPNRIDFATRGTFFNVSPYLILKPGIKGNPGIIPYARLGLLTGLASVTSISTMTRATGKSIDKYSGNWSFGLISALGLSRQLNKKINLFAELTIKTIGFKPKQLRNIENFDGQDSGNVTRFVKEVDPNGPTNNELAFLIPFNSAGLSFGYEYKLGR